LQSQDLARAFVQVLGNEKASKQVFNISGEKYVTFDGLAKACAKVILSNTFLNGHTVKELCDFLICRKLSSMYFSSVDYLLFICFLLGTGWWIS
jgi:nucleoside-diphosphate-sugar epimerase